MDIHGMKVLQEKQYEGFVCRQLDCTTEVRHPTSSGGSWTSREFIWSIEGICEDIRDCMRLTSFAACRRAINEHLEDERIAQLEEEEEDTWREMFEAEYRRMESEMREGVE